MKNLVRILLVSLAVMLALSGCKSSLVRVKPTPTAAAAASAPAGQNGADPETVRIVTEGKVMPARSATLSFGSGGIISQAPVTVGQKVAAGDLLAQLDTKVLELQLAQAEANLAASQAKLKRAGRGRPAGCDCGRTGHCRRSGELRQADRRTDRGGCGSRQGRAFSALPSKTTRRVRKGPSAESLNQLAAQMASAQASLTQAQAAYDQVRDRADVAMMPQSLALQQATIQSEAAQSAYEKPKNHPTAAELAAAASQVQQAQAALDRLAAKPADIEARRGPRWRTPRRSSTS